MGYSPLIAVDRILDMTYPITPVELAKELGHEPESRPGKCVRDYLRSRYPDHVPNQRWKLKEDQAEDVRAHFNRR